MRETVARSNGRPPGAPERSPSAAVRSRSRAAHEAISALIGEGRAVLDDAPDARAPVRLDGDAPDGCWDRGGAGVWQKGKRNSTERSTPTGVSSCPGTARKTDAEPGTTVDGSGARPRAGAVIR